MDRKVFSSKGECGEKVKALIKSKKAKGYRDGSTKKRKRRATTSSDADEDDDEEVQEPPSKRRRKMSPPPNKTLLRKLLQASSVLLEHHEEDQSFEVMVEDKKFTSVKAEPVGSKGRKYTKKFSTKRKAMDGAISALCKKMREGFTIVESGDEDEDEEESASEEEGEEEDEGVLFGKVN